MLVAVVAVALIWTAYKLFDAASTMLHAPVRPAHRSRAATEEYERTLAREPCDRRAASALAATLVHNGEPRAAVDSARAFLARCGEHERLREVLYSAYSQLSEWNAAAAQATKLIDQNPLEAEYYGWRGFALEKNGDLGQATIALKQSLLLDPSRADVPLALAKVYERQGKPCDAILPLEQLLFRHDGKRGIEAVRARVSQLYALPDCNGAAGSGYARIPVQAGQTGIIARVRVSGSKAGFFVVDTGASYVVLSRRFAKRLGIDADRLPSVTMQTVSGVIQARVGLLDKVEVQGAVAERVPAAIAEDLGPYDGLLGLSFLSRFEIRQSRDLFEIKAPVRANAAAAMGAPK